MKINGQEVETEELTVKQRDGKPYIVTSPLPEYIAVTPSLWDNAAERTDTDSIDGEEDERPWAWIETLGHADEDVDNDGHVLHLDATNVVTSYKLMAELEDGTRILHLVAWAER